MAGLVGRIEAFPERFPINVRSAGIVRQEEEIKGGFQILNGLFLHSQHALILIPGFPVFTVRDAIFPKVIQEKERRRCQKQQGENRF